MKPFDFDRNTYQSTIEFKFGCLTSEFVSGVVEEQLVQRKQFTTVGENPETGEVTLVKGDGTQAAPLYNLKLTDKQIVVWTGWYVQFDDSLNWRRTVLGELLGRLAGLPVEFVQALTTQHTLSIPADRLVEPGRAKELEPLLDLYKTIVPDRLLKRLSAVMTFGDAQGGETAQVWAGGAAVTGDETMGLNYQQTVFRAGMRLPDIVTVHLDEAEKLVTGFATNFLAVILKAAAGA